MKFSIFIFKDLSRQFVIKICINKGKFACRSVYVYDKISLIYLYNVSHKTVHKVHTLSPVTFFSENWVLNYKCGEMWLTTDR